MSFDSGGLRALLVSRFGAAVRAAVHAYRSGGGCCCWPSCPCACWSMCRLDLRALVPGRRVRERLRQGGARGAAAASAFSSIRSGCVHARPRLLLPVRRGAGAGAQRPRRCGRPQRRLGSSVLAQLRTMVARRCAGQPDRHAHPVLLGAAAAEPRHVQPAANHRGGALGHRPAHQPVIRVRTGGASRAISRETRLLRASAIHGLGGDPFPHVRRNRGRVAMLSIFAVDAAIDRTGSFANLSIPEMSSRLQHFLLLRIAPLYLAAVLIEQWARVNNSLRESEAAVSHHCGLSAPMMMWTSDHGRRLRIRQPALAGFHRHVARRDSLAQGWAKSLHPDDLQQTFDYYLPHFQRAHSPWRCSTARGVTTANIRWVITRMASPRFGANGEFIGFIGSAIDMTERRQQEAGAAAQRGAAIATWSKARSAFVCRFLSRRHADLRELRVLPVHSADPREQLLGRKLSRVAAAWSARGGARGDWSGALGARDAPRGNAKSSQADGARGWQSWACHAIEPASRMKRANCRPSAMTSPIASVPRNPAGNWRRPRASRPWASSPPWWRTKSISRCAPFSAMPKPPRSCCAGENPPLDEIREHPRRHPPGRPARRRRHSQHPLAAAPTRIQAGAGGCRRHHRACAQAHRGRCAAPSRDACGARSDPGCRWSSAIVSHLEQVLVILIVNAMDAMKDTPEGCASQVRDHGAQRGHGGWKSPCATAGTASPPPTWRSCSIPSSPPRPTAWGSGLSIARSMMTAHGGRIWAENAPDGGAAFRFTLAVAQIPATA